MDIRSKLPRNPFTRTFRPQKHVDSFEVLNAWVLFGWAYILLATDVHFKYSPIFRAMYQIMPSQIVWGLIALLISGLCAFGMIAESYSDKFVWMRRTSTFLALMWWSLVAAMLYSANPQSTGVFSYGAFVFLSIWMFARSCIRDDKTGKDTKTDGVS